MLHSLRVLSASDLHAASGRASAVPQDPLDGPVLEDRFGRQHTYLRISLLEQCNLRCTYCMPADGLDWTPREELLTVDEWQRLGHLFVGAGITKIRLTGGEPLLHPAVTTLATDFGALDGLQTLALTTNGLLLPKKLPALRAAGLRQLNISLDTLRADRFRSITRRDGFSLVLRAIDQALEVPGLEVKVNCVVMRGVNDDEVLDFVQWTEDRALEVRFIEFMPFDGNRWDDGRLVPFDELRTRIRTRFQLESLTDEPSATARTFRVPGHAGTIGVIASMTEPFCEGCNRLRLTADGNLKVCLFGQAEVSLRDAMRAGASDDDLLHRIGHAVRRKHARHAGMHQLSELPNRPMITIGG